MKKKVIINRGNRSLYMFIRRLAAAISFGIVVFIICNSSITIKGTRETYQYQIGPFDEKDVYEKSEIFNDILRRDILDITRMAVIKSQMETNGSYNGQKRIDVVEFAHRQEDLPEEQSGAEFLLDDLIKWGNYGFTEETVYGTEAELNAYFQKGSSSLSTYVNNELSEDAWRTQSSVQRSSLQNILDSRQEETLSMKIINEMPSSLEEYRNRMEALGEVVDESEIISLNVLVPRYLSADGTDLAEYASSAQKYVELRKCLEIASEELFSNFQEYSEFKNLYADGKTNIRYCYRMNVDGNIEYFTNMEGNFSDKDLDEITALFKEYGSYIVYNADRAEMDTNTLISVDNIREALTYYQYAYGDNTMIWIAVDTEYPVADSLRTGRDAFNRIMPYYWLLVSAAVVAGLFSLFLFLILTKFEGRVEDESERGFHIAMRKGDKFPTEPFFLSAAVVLGVLGGAVYGWNRLFHDSYRVIPNNEIWLPVIAGAVLFLFDYVIMSFYFGLVRRIKGRTLWKNSLSFIAVKKIREWIWMIYDNSRTVTRAVIPFLFLMAVNLILGSTNAAGIIIAALIDMAAVILLFRERRALEKIVEGIQNIRGGDLNYKISLENMHGENRILAEAVNGIGDGIKSAVDTSMKDEKLKTDLITNVSHDIKTPLTSIINFVNLLKREKIEDERIKGYIAVLDSKSQRLKQLTDDLVEASKITSGNISLHMERINFGELINQTTGEFSDKLKEKCLQVIFKKPEKTVYIEADSRRIWRVVENLFSNVYKYALEGTRVYMDIKIIEKNDRQYAVFSMKNISAQALNIPAEELTERFIRGDVSRSTEGSGLGLSIARSLTEIQNGKFEIYLDGDLFKVLLTFPLYEEKETLEEI